MRIAITGHTSGIGLALFQHFAAAHDVCGFSRSNGYDISTEAGRAMVMQQARDCDIFINNAYHNFDRSQYLLLESMWHAWQGQGHRTIINISTRWTNGDHAYCKTKLEQDKFCLERVGQWPRIINVKPGLIDTPRVKNISGNRMQVATVVQLIQYILDTESNFNITSITFGL